jgi:hypothetical protein
MVPKRGSVLATLHTVSSSQRSQRRSFKACEAWVWVNSDLPKLGTTVMVLPAEPKAASYAAARLFFLEERWSDFNKKPQSALAWQLMFSEKKGVNKCNRIEP